MIATRMTFPKPGGALFNVLLVIAGGMFGILVMSLVRSGDGGSVQSTSVATPVPVRPTAREDSAVTREVKSEDAGSGEVFSALSDAISNPDRDARAEGLRHLAERLAGEDIKKALALGAKIPDANDKIEYMRALFAAWAKRDPAAALDFAKAQFKPGLLQSETMIAAIEKWAGANPRDAFQWLEKNTSGPLKEEGLTMLVQGWAHNDPQAAAAWFTSTGSTSQSVLNSLVSTWADLNPQAAAAWVESLPAGENRVIGRVSLASEWAQQSPADAAAYFTPMMNEKGGQDIAAALVNSWGTSDPAAASEWLQKLPAGPAREESAGALATIWAASDINAAVKWSETLSSPDIKSAVIDHLGTTWGAIEPEKALAWLGTLPADDTQREATRGALNSWAGTDPEGMKAWVAKQPPGANTDAARLSLGEVLTESDPPGALQTALAIGNSDARSDAVSKFFRIWRKTDDAAAQAWLKQTWPTLPPDAQLLLTKEQARKAVPR